MNLELKDRLFLRNQCKILARLDENEADYWNRMVEVLERGYEADYSDFTAHFSGPVSEEDTAFVLEVLDMHKAFEWAKQDGTEVPKDDTHIFDFHGFDGRDESALHRYASFAVRQPNSWDSLKGKELNSHIALSSRYRVMLAAWEKSTEKYKLTPEDFKRIAAAVKSERQ